MNKKIMDLHFNELIFKYIKETLEHLALMGIQERR